MLLASGHKLYFYSSYSKENAEERMEVDFLIAKRNISNRHNISPIEVKSGRKYALASITKFINKFSKLLSTPYIIHSSDLKEEKLLLMNFIKKCAFCGFLYRTQVYANSMRRDSSHDALCEPSRRIVWLHSQRRFIFFPTAFYFFLDGNLFFPRWGFSGKQVSC